VGWLGAYNTFQYLRPFLLHYIQHCSYAAHSTFVSCFSNLSLHSWVPVGWFGAYNTFFKIQYLRPFLLHYIQHCFICRPSDFTVPKEASIEPRTVATCTLCSSSQTLLDPIHLGWISSTTRSYPPHENISYSPA
jgi:hypothetical protein